MKLKAINAAVLFLPCLTSLAQNDHAFRIVGAEGNVTLDGASVAVGQEVTTASSKLVIPEGSQIASISPFAEIERPGPDEHDVAMLGDKKHWLALSRTGHYDGPMIRPQIKMGSMKTQRYFITSVALR